MDQLVTGEAVALEVRPARLPSRALAVVLDLMVVLLAWVIVMMLLFATMNTVDDAAGAAISLGTFLLIPVGAPIAVEALTRGRSLGKLALGLRVVRDDGGPIGFRHALVRGLIGMFELILTFGVVACIASLASARGRRLGDVFAGTLVVRERVPGGQVTGTPPPPPWLIGRFAALDLSAVPDDLWLAVRQYLTRMFQLDPAVGHEVAHRLAGDVAARTGAQTQGMSAPEFLGAVFYERQIREAARAQAAAQARARVQAPVGGAYPSPVGGAAPTWGQAPGYGSAPAPGYGPAAAPGYGSAPAPGYGSAPAPGYGSAPAPGYG
ncbi:RDD family protein, partial [Streptomyces fragilis]|uniref:RDD family protein n=1 Tax=Streptomyces fragilis TaxID=67301 RepID=UPI0024DE09C3